MSRREFLTSAVAFPLAILGCAPPSTREPAVAPVEAPPRNSDATVRAQSMKILKPGSLSLDPPATLGGTCRKCGCQVEVSRVDIQHTRSTTRLYEGKVPCPTVGCGAEIEVYGVSG